MNLTLQIILTAAIVAITITLFVLERIFIKRREETIKIWVLVLLFLSSLIVFLAGAFGIVWVMTFIYQ